MASQYDGSQTAEQTAGISRRSAADTAREPKTPADAAKGPILYRRTADVERYYRSLYRA